MCCSLVCGDVRGKLKALFGRVANILKKNKGFEVWCLLLGETTGNSATSWRSISLDNKNCKPPWDVVICAVYKYTFIHLRPPLKRRLVLLVWSLLWCALLVCATAKPSKPQNLRTLKLLWLVHLSSVELDKWNVALYSVVAPITAITSWPLKELQCIWKKFRATSWSSRCFYVLGVFLEQVRNLKRNGKHIKAEPIQVRV